MWIASVVLFALAVTHLFPLLRTYSEQDACDFGPVGNARYRELLSEAKRLQRTWPPLIWGNLESAKQLQARSAELSKETASVYERIAAMHAILRALGAVYRRTGHGSSDPYQSALDGAGIVPFHYHLDVNRLGFFRPLWREMWVIGSLAVKNAYGPFRRPLAPGETYFTVWFPEFLETYVRIPSSGGAGPRVPSDELAEQLANTGK